jgi:hypothetical protein
MLLPTDDSPMDYLHPLVVLPNDVAETLFSEECTLMRTRILGSAKSEYLAGRSDSVGLKMFDSLMWVY